VQAGSPGAVLRGVLERAGRTAQINTFGGGVNEVQREIVATAGLGMPRQARQAAK
jgi:alkylation response protein AidB-like acyl-CoA dehydrogenase